jgi:hypothetical protein
MSPEISIWASDTGQRHEALLRISEALSACREPEDLTSILSEKIADALRAGPEFITGDATLLDWPSAGRRIHDVAYPQLAPVDFSRDVLANLPHRLLVLRDRTSGWADLGSPARVLDTLSRNGIQPQWAGEGGLVFDHQL